MLGRRHHGCSAHDRAWKRSRQFLSLVREGARGWLVRRLRDSRTHALTPPEPRRGVILTAGGEP